MGLQEGKRPDLTGRVPPSSCFHAYLDGQWRSSEPVAVVIPDHFTVRCRSEFETIRDVLEAAEGSPEASSSVLADSLPDIAATHCTAS